MKSLVPTQTNAAELAAPDRVAGRMASRSSLLRRGRARRSGERQRRFIAIFWWAALMGSSACAPAAESTNEVFAGPPSAYAPALKAEGGKSEGNVLRYLSVEERAGAARQGALVRAPIFFLEGECRTLEELAIVALDSAGNPTGAPLVWQADDIRHGPDGGLSRLHAWFEADVPAGAKRRFALVRATGQAAPRVAAMQVTRSGGEIRVATGQGDITWSQRGALRGWKTGNALWDFGREGLFPRILIAYGATENSPAEDVVLDRSTSQTEVLHAAGPLFTKMRVKLTHPTSGVTLEQEYRIPRHGTELIVSSAIFVGSRPGGAVKENRLFEGKLPSATQRATALAEIPAGIRREYRDVHAYTVHGLTQKRAEASLLAIPTVIGGSNGRLELDDAALSLRGAGGLTRGSEGEKETLRAYWTEVRLVPAATAEPDKLWENYRAAVQPLVAVVDEPGVTVDDLHAALRNIALGMKPIGWRQQAGRLYVLDEPAKLEKVLKELEKRPNDANPELLLRSARATRAKATDDGKRRLREDEKERTSGPLDVYHVTYTQSPAAVLAALGRATPHVLAVNRAMAAAVREFSGRKATDGSPYIDCFNRALNMQMGPVLFGVTSAKLEGGDAELGKFYREVATAPAVLGIFGRGQRPYSGARATRADTSDYLYQAISDFWLRTTEILAREDLQLHPLAFSRHTDCIDVMADRYHAWDAQDKAGTAGQARANFFRGQPHTHRWLGWSCAPFIRLLEDPAEGARVGLTEAVRYAQGRKGRWNNWPDLSFYLIADMMVREGLPRLAESRGPGPSSP